LREEEEAIVSLDRLFYPRSIAVVGASESLGGGKLPYFQSLQHVGFPGPLYPVNPKHERVGGVRAYPSIEDLPEGVDLAIVAVPVRQALEVIRAAVRKKIPFVHFFTSGFSEAGNRKLEEDLVREARKGGVRIVGPNGVGVYCQESRLSFGPGIQEGPPGMVAFLGQSGGITGNFMATAATRKIPVNKAVSYGNQIDLRVEDFLEYLADDSEIRLIACYIEDVKDGRRFLQVLRHTTAKKPVVILKGGRTETGARAAASHTGALAGNDQIWTAAVKQHGAILTENFDQLMNLVMLATAPKPIRGKRVGFVGAGGGISVLFTDLAVRAGLSLPELEEKTQRRIGLWIKEVNTSTANPVDLGAFGFDLRVMTETMKALDDDANIDVIIPYFLVEYLLRSEVLLKVKNSEESFFEMAREIQKPVIPILSCFVEDNLDLERTRISTFAAMRKAGFPVYPRIQDAVYVIGVYFQWLEQRRRLKVL
jgi:acetyl-CoA synthetase (ADP-forming)/acetyltransferase